MRKKGSVTNATHSHVPPTPFPWFNVVMGGGVVTDAKTAERIAERIPLPEAVQQELSIDLAL